VSTDQVAVVTGGARGIGYAVAASLAGGGYHTVILDNGTALDGHRRDQAPLVEAADRLRHQGAGVEALLCDVSDPEAVKAVAADLLQRLGRVDVLANVAGILRPGPFLDDTEETWRMLLTIHLGGHLNTIQAFLPQMLARGSGHLVNFTSTAALLGSRRQPGYSTAKEAIVGLTRYLSSRLGASGVRVNAVSPGAATRMSAGQPPPRLPDGTEVSGPMADRDPSHVGRFVRWLVSEADRIDGGIFLVTGNYVTEFEHMRPSKWIPLQPDEHGPQLDESLRWVIGRPHPTLIGPWPTRDFRLLELERDWEGTGIELARGASTTGRPGGGPLGPVIVLGPDDGRSRAVSRSVGARGQAWFDSASVDPRLGGPARPHWPDSGAEGVVAVLPGGQDARAPATGTGRNAADLDVDVNEVCSALADALRCVQSGIRLTAAREGRGTVMVLPGWLPWLDQDASLSAWLRWYGGVGAVRGGASNEALYGVRVNAVTMAADCEDRLGQLLEYLYSAKGNWLNGYLFAADGQGLSLLADERPRWQVFSGDFRQPMPESFLSQISNR
jgi:NAD(P)-dependent dehydrogenase (short-subunit alcohol dehydrogenase family)